MAIIKIHELSAILPPYGEIFPQDYQEGERLPVQFFMHGIGELATKKTLTAMVAFHKWLQTAADKKRIIYVLPQDDGKSLFDDNEILKLLPVIEKYSNGQVCLSGLSRGAGTTLSIAGSTSPVKKVICCYIAMCPPTWEGMNEKALQELEEPLWIFAR